VEAQPIEKLAKKQQQKCSADKKVSRNSLSSVYSTLFVDFIHIPCGN
jgi:hypothetical protein